MSPARFLRTDAMLASLVLVMGAAAPAVAGEPADDAAPHLVYVPSRAASVDHDAMIAAFGERGFIVDTLPFAGESEVTYARRIARHVRGLMHDGVDPEHITVVGAGSGSPVATLASAATGHRRVNYVLLGGCDREMRDRHRFRMAGRVLGMRADSDEAAHSCRPMWNGEPRVGERRDLVIASPLGARLFDRPNEEWMRPLAQWSRGGRVEVGEVRVGMVQQPARGARGAP